MRSPHRIVRILARLNIGGPAINATLLTGALNHGEFATKLVTGHVGRGEGDMSYYATAQGVQPHYIPELGPELGMSNDARAFAKLLPFVLREQPAIVHTHTAKAGALGRAAAIAARTPIIVHTFHGHVFRHYFGQRQTQLFLRVERALAARTSAIIAISERQRAEIVDEFAVAPRGRVHVIRLGFDLDPFLRCQEQRGGLRAELGLDRRIHLAGIIGRLVSIKNHALFLEAAARVMAEAPTAHFVIVGDGPLRADLEAQAQLCGLTGKVHFLGWRRDMARIYADLDVVVLTSRNEGTPVALIEAQAAGVPVVATDVGGVGDTLLAGETGWLAAEDASAVAERILRALQDPQFRARAQECGPPWARARYSKERLLTEVTGLYRGLLAAAV